MSCRPRRTRPSRSPGRSSIVDRERSRTRVRAADLREPSSTRLQVAPVRPPEPARAPSRPEVALAIERGSSDDRADLPSSSGRRRIHPRRNRPGPSATRGVVDPLHWPDVPVAVAAPSSDVGEWRPRQRDQAKSTSASGPPPGRTRRCRRRAGGSRASPRAAGSQLLLDEVDPAAGDGVDVAGRGEPGDRADPRRVDPLDRPARRRRPARRARGGRREVDRLVAAGHGPDGLGEQVEPGRVEAAAEREVGVEPARGRRTPPSRRPRSRAGSRARRPRRGP